MTQQKQAQWHDQWSLFRDNELFLFKDWIYPNTLEDFRGKSVLEGGCGGGHHTSFIAPYAKEIVSVDLNTVDIAKERTKEFQNINFVEGDLATVDLGRQFDIVFSIGVVHITDDPTKSFENLKRHVKPGGRMILWVYSREGNFLAERFVEPLRKTFLSNMDRKRMKKLSKFITFLMYPPVYSVYQLPLKFLPYYEYFQNFRKLSFDRNTLNVFDKLNCPQTEFVTKEKMNQWFNPDDFTDIHISPYKGVSWRGSGTKK